MNIYNDDCFNVFPKIADKTIDLFVLDLPYANKDFGKCTACKWDNTIDLDKMWVEIKRIMKSNAVIIFFCNTKFGFSLIKSNMKWFRYDLIFKKKSRKVGFLSANKMPLRQHENIYVFSDDTHENKTDINNERNKELREYADQVKKYIGKSIKQINEDMGNRYAEHFFYITSTQFAIPTEETYNKLIEIYKIDKMKPFIDYKTLKSKWEKHPPKPETTYNPQKTEGTPYNIKESSLTNSYYRGGQKEYKSIAKENKGDRHPTSIIEHENVYVFSDDNNDDLDNSRNKELREYADQVKKYIGKSLKQINKDMRNRHAEHFFYITSTQFLLPTEETYNKLIEIYKIDKMKPFIDYKTLKSKWEKEPETTYNPQKTEGTPYKTTGKGIVGVYNTKRVDNKNKGDRHPTSIIEHENVYVFGGLNEDNDELIKYSKKILKFIGKTKAEIKRNIKDADHFFRYSKDNFSMPTEETYNKLIAFYKINEMEGFIDYKDLVGKTTYNPQKTEGTPYNIKESSLTNSYYRGGQKEYKSIAKENKGDRHPTSIIEHENVYVFSNDNNNDLDHSRNKELRSYAEKVKKYIGKSLKIIDKKIGNQGIHHFYGFTSTQFGIPIEKNYNKLIEIYKINEMDGFIDYKTLKSKWEKEPETTYNPQKTEGTPYKPNRKTETNVYGTIKLTNDENKGDRHPTSIYPDTIETTILEHKSPHKTLHRTQKPLSLCEWLIKTYSNEGDVVMDFTMGSGTTGEACINTKRKFIGVELDKEIFEIAENRLNNKTNNI